MNYRVSKFDNGLRLVTCPMTDAKSVSMGVWVGVGGRYEEDKISGVSHFLEHMLFKGTKKRTAKQISQAIEGVGGNTNAFTTEECTCFYAKVTDDHFDQTLDVLADMFKNPLFKSSDIERERGVILEELRMNVDVPAHRVFEILRELMWEKHPLGRMLIGTETTIKNIKRSDLVKFKEQNYTGPNIVVSIAGSMSQAKTISQVEKKFSFLKPENGLSYLPAVENQAKPETRIFKKKTEQTNFCIGIRALARNHEDRFALRVLNAILGENMSSRLFQEIREKQGLSYDIGSSIERFLDAGTLIISGGVDIKNLEKAIERTLKELGKVKKGSIRKEELSMAKEYSIGQLILGLEKSSSQMIYLGESEICSGNIMDIKELIRRIRAVKLEDVERVAQFLFVDKKINLAVVGPVEKDKTIQNLFSMN